MTTREYIARRLRIWGFLPILAVIAFLFALVITVRMPHYIALIAVVVSIALIFVAGIGATMQMVCPFCKQWIGPILRFGVSPIVRGLPKKIKYCPLCGVSFDSEMNKNTANQQIHPIAGDGVSPII